MKNQVDAVVREFLFNKDRKSPEHMHEWFVFLRLDGLSVALELLAVLARWANDKRLAEVDRFYAEKQLNVCLEKYQ